MSDSKSPKVPEKRKPYVKPTLKTWGTIFDITRTDLGRRRHLMKLFRGGSVSSGGC